MKRHQVFVSSTYEDLKEERTEVLHALLELDCIPCGMEYFPASDESQWQYIKGLIELCDYYLLIVGGRYGSLDDKGLSYTEKEYRHAISKNIPVIAFVHGSPEKLPVNKTDDDSEKKKKLQDFRKLVQKKLCKQWETKEQLGALASRSMIQLIKSHPRIGWIRADEATNPENLKELLIAKNKIKELQSQLNEINKFSLNTKELSFGDEKVSLSYFLFRTENWGEGRKLMIDDENFTWNEIFDFIAPKLSFPLNSVSFNTYLNQFLHEKLTVKHKKDVEDLMEVIESSKQKIILKFTDDTLATIKIQFMALGFLTEKFEKREKKNIKMIELTQYGQEELVRRKARRKNKNSR
ncbi:MAG: DUF4062 domain-containing protein [Cruoricaptor ignavus]|nr:DUF4062 domain-containing protein [Cruoricaptor ignavus]